jgi:hypothetical protein
MIDISDGSFIRTGLADQVESASKRRRGAVIPDVADAHNAAIRALLATFRESCEQSRRSQLQQGRERGRTRRK